MIPSATKFGENTINILKLLFFEAYLHFGISNLLSTYRKTSPIQFSFGLIFSWNPNKSHTDQYNTSFLLSLKRNDSTFKNSNWINFFSIVHVMVTTYLDKCFLFHVITGSYCFIKVYWYPEVSSRAMFLRSLKQVIWKKKKITLEACFY